MILADTSVWIEFLSKGNDPMAHHLEEGEILTHPVVLGELAVGNLSNRQTVLEDLMLLPRIPPASDEETLYLIEAHHLWGKGLHWNDVQLLASALASSVPLWTLDRKLQTYTRKLAV